MNSPKRAMIVAAFLLGAVTYGQSTAETPRRTVTICMEGAGANQVDIMRAQHLASKIFSEIAVTLSWHVGLKGCSKGAILISLSLNTNDTLEPSAFGDTRPYEGTVRVFYDRIYRVSYEAGLPELLGHVLVHEIAHALQGVPRHSEHGIMKAHWDLDDMTRMNVKPLQFEHIDIDLIHRGLEKRSANAAAETKAESITVAAR